MYHPYRKNNTLLRQALIDVYHHKCVYCGTLLQPRYMQVDHIIPSNPEPLQGDDLIRYLDELEQEGFISDSIENYLPSCSACNDRKNNQVYSVASLRYFHELAIRNSDEVLKRIAEIRERGPERFYEPLDPCIWEEISFDYQRSISYAIMGYRLSPKDVEACPRFPQVERVKKQLGIVDYVLLQGEPGCGKSITAYQAAYDLHQMGWSVYRLRAKEENPAIRISDNTNPSLYIIDDAQLLSEQTLERLAEQTRPNAKMVITRTVTSDMCYDTILMTNRDAVKQLYEDFLKRKIELTPIVHNADHQIGVNFLDTPFERRLDQAREAATPWQFNYILRGGWQSMKEQYQTICTHHNCDLLAASIAVFQIVHLDNSVDYKFLCKQLHSINTRFSWCQEDLTYLVNRKIVLSQDEVRIIHIESAHVIISQFLRHSTAEKQETLCKVLENAFLSGYFSSLGLVWLCNGVERFLPPFDAQRKFISEKMVDFTLNRLSSLQTSQERRDAAYFLDKFFDMEYPRNGLYYFISQEPLWLEWISHTDSENAYAYSRVLNTLYNHDKTAYTHFVSKVDWTPIMETLCRESHPNLYAWSSLISRLAIRRGSKLQNSALESAIRTMRDSVSTDNIAGFSDFLSHAGYLVPACVHETINLLAPVYKSFFKNDLERGLDFLDFEFFLSICGICLLGGHRATPSEKKSASVIVDALPEAELSSYVSHSLPRNWQKIHEVMLLIAKYDSKKARRIAFAVDLEQLSSGSKDLWSSSSEIDQLCIALYLGNPSVARRFIEMNKNHISAANSILIGMAPTCIAELFQKNIPLDILDSHNWDINAWALQSLFKADADVAKIALSNSCLKIVERLNHLSKYDLEDNGCILFLRLVQQSAPDIWERIKANINSKLLVHCLDNESITPQKKRSVKKHLCQLCNLFEVECQ